MVSFDIIVILHVVSQCLASRLTAVVQIYIRSVMLFHETSYTTCSDVARGGKRAYRTKKQWKKFCMLFLNWRYVWSEVQITDGPGICCLNFREFVLAIL